MVLDPLDRFSVRGGHVSSHGPLRSHPILPQFPVISRGLPKASSQGNAFGGTLDEANAIDADYGTTWASVNSANAAPQWYAIDLRGVAAAAKSNCWFVWKHWGGNYFEPSATLGASAGSVFSSLPRNYRLQGHTSSGALPAVGDVGWTDIPTTGADNPVTDNRYNQRIHRGLNLSGYNWFRFYCTASSGVTGSSEDIQLEFDLRDARGSLDDTFLFHGDSITWEGFGLKRPGNVYWHAVAPIENAIQAATGRVAPVAIDAGVSGWTAADADTNKATYIGGAAGAVCKYVTLNFGSNDANLANIDLNTLSPAGVNSTYAQGVKTHFQSLVDYCYSLGKVAIIPRIPWGNTSAWSAPNIQILNTIIDQVIAANPGKVIGGPDLYSFFAAHTALLRDALHPTFDEAVPAGMFNGLTGYENMLALWRDKLIASFY